jgi:hypothetical protein
MPYGLWIGTAEADCVYSGRGTTSFRATCIALHEIAHLLLGHHGIATLYDLACSLAPDTGGCLLLRAGSLATRFSPDVVASPA